MSCVLNTSAICCKTDVSEVEGVALLGSASGSKSTHAYALINCREPGRWMQSWLPARRWRLAGAKVAHDALALCQVDVCVVMVEGARPVPA